MTDSVERLGYLNDALLACGSDYSDILLNAVNEIRQIRQQLAECQAREKATPKSNYEKGVFNPVFESPSDSATIDTMLKQAKREALIEAAEDFEQVCPSAEIARCAVGDELRYMAEELK